MSNESDDTTPTRTGRDILRGTTIRPSWEAPNTEREAVVVNWVSISPEALYDAIYNAILSGDTVRLVAAGVTVAELRPALAGHVDEDPRTDKA